MAQTCMECIHSSLTGFPSLALVVSAEDMGSSKWCYWWFLLTIPLYRLSWLLGQRTWNLFFWLRYRSSLCCRLVLGILGWLGARRCLLWFCRKCILFLFLRNFSKHSLMCTVYTWSHLYQKWMICKMTAVCKPLHSHSHLESSLEELLMHHCWRIHYSIYKQRNQSL